jgi:hypothetical protein
MHILDAGEVLGAHVQTSVTVGFRSRVEVGVTRSSVFSVGSGDVASLFDRGFTTLNAKVSLVVEEEGASTLPGISVGGLVRWQSEHIGADVVPSDPTQNADIYVVATKTLEFSQGLSALVSGGARATDASFLGVAGNVPSREVRGFASGGLLFGGRVLLGGEFLQQPAHLDGFPLAEMPSTVSLFARVFPNSSGRFNLDLAVVRIAGEVAPGLDLKAENRLAAGGSFRF